MNEHTASGLSGLHFGHLKACAQDKILTHFESLISHIPFSTGFSPKFWQQSIITMIKKRVKSNNVKNLRSIVLTEADFNFNNKVLGKYTMQHAEEKNLIAIEQYGSRKGCSAVDHALHK